MTANTKPAAQSEPVSKDRLRLWLRLLKVNKMIEVELRERLRTEFATTLPRFDVLSALSRTPAGMKMSELSRMLMVSNGNVTGIIERLTEDGLTLREAVPGDRRAARVRLTAKGKAEFEKQATAHEAWVAEMLDGLEQADCLEAINILSSAHALNEPGVNDAH